MTQSADSKFATNLNCLLELAQGYVKNGDDSLAACKAVSDLDNAIDYLGAGWYTSTTEMVGNVIEESHSDYLVNTLRTDLAEWLAGTQRETEAARKEYRRMELNGKLIQDAMGRISPQRAKVTNRLHEEHEAAMLDHYPNLPDCDICGGKLNDMRDERHERCRLRKKDGLDTPRIDYKPECPCWPCRNRR